MLGLTTTRHLRIELAAAKAETDRQRERAEKAEKAEATAVFNRGQAIRQFDNADGQLKAARKRLAEQKPAADLDDVHRKALADALGKQGHDRGWEQLIAETAGLQGQVEALGQRLGRANERLLNKAAELRLAREDSKPMEGGAIRPVTPSAELRQAREQARALAERLAEVAAANQACTCGGQS